VKKQKRKLGVCRIINYLYSRHHVASPFLHRLTISEPRINYVKRFLCLFWELNLAVTSPQCMHSELKLLKPVRFELKMNVAGKAVFVALEITF